MNSVTSSYAGEDSVWFDFGSLAYSSNPKAEPLVRGGECYDPTFAGATSHAEFTSCRLSGAALSCRLSGAELVAGCPALSIYSSAGSLKAEVY